MKTNTLTINDHRIDVPLDMKVTLDRFGPGAYDSISYRGWEICTFETGKTVGKKYVGPFVISREGYGDMIEVETLALVRVYIDTHQEAASNYMTRDEILSAEVGVTGIVKIIDGVFFEMVVSGLADGRHGWTAWDSPARDGMRSSVDQEEAKRLALI